jgi:hypothetical protein
MDRHATDADHDPAAHARDSEFVHLLDRARSLVQAVEDLGRFWDELSYQVENGNPAPIKHLVDRFLVVERERWSKIQEEHATAIAGAFATFADHDLPALERYRQTIAEPASQVARLFVREFPEEAERKGLKLDATSRFPEYTFHGGFMTLRVFRDEYRAEVSTRDGGDPSPVDLDVPRAVAWIKAEEKRLFERAYPEPLLEKLLTAYDAVIREDDNLQRGDDVSLRRVMNRYAKNLPKLRPFRADEFNVDLARIIKEGRVSTRGVRMSVGHTRNKKQGMLLHGLEDGGFMGFINFKEEK